MVYIKHLSHLFPDIEATLVNTSGRKLLTVCSSYRLESANGQIPGDKRGNFTCFNYRAASVGLPSFGYVSYEKYYEIQSPSTQL